MANNNTDWMILIIQLALSGAVGYGATTFKMGKYIEKVDMLCSRIRPLSNSNAKLIYAIKK